MLRHDNRDRSSTLRTGAMQTVTGSMSGLRTRKYEIAAAISTKSRKLRIWSHVRDDDVSRMQSARDRSQCKTFYPLRVLPIFSIIFNPKNTIPSRSKFKRSILNLYTTLFGQIMVSIYV